MAMARVHMGARFLVEKFKERTNSVLFYIVSAELLF